MLVIRSLNSEDQQAWRRLYMACAAYHGITIDLDQANVVWSWLRNPAHVFECLVAEESGKLIGLAHFRGAPCTLQGREIGFLDDLFVDSSMRGRGIASLLLKHLREQIAIPRQWLIVRWYVDDNYYPARRLYERIAHRTTWNLYEMTEANFGDLPNVEETVRPLRAGDFDGWQAMHFAYHQDRQKLAKLQQISAQIWQWLIDPTHALNGFIAEVDGRGVGFVHYREMPRPLQGNTRGSIDDLFVMPNRRGGSIAKQLVLSIHQMMACHNWSMVRWLVEDDNYRARAVFDKVAANLHWCVYEMSCGSVKASH